MESDRLIGPGKAGPDRVNQQEIIFNRWQSFSVVCLFVSVVGTTYAYGVYSDLLKDNLGFSQHGLDIVASVGNTGLYLSLLAGLALERFGLQVVISGGGFLIFIGFLYIWAAVEGYVPANIASICVFFFLSQFGVCCHVSSSVTFGVRLFPPESRGISVGLVKGYFGLSSAVLGDFAGGYFGNSPSSFLLFVAFFIPLVGGIYSHFANLLPAEEIPFRKTDSKSMAPFIIHWIVLFLVIFTIGVLQFLLELPDYVNTISSTVLLITLFTMVAIPGFYGPRYITIDNRANDASSFSSRAALVASVGKAKQDASLDDDEAEEIQMAETPASSCFYGDSVPFLTAIFTWRFWAMYMIFLTMTGVGLMVIYNVNAIASSVGKHPSTFFVSLLSLANGLGRVLAGFLCDKTRQYLSKLELLSIVILCMAIAQALHSIGSPNLLYPCLLSVGFLFGCTVSLMAVNIADIFGGVHIATIFGMIDSAAISGTVIFAAGLVYLFYKEDSNDDVTGDDSSDACYETNCFRVPFIINAVCCLAVFTLCLYVNWKTPRLNQGSAH